MKYQEKELECIYCGRPFGLNEIFICHVNSKELITICSHLDCGEANTKKEKDGGWVAVERTLQGYEVHSK